MGVWRMANSTYGARLQSRDWRSPASSFDRWQGPPEDSTGRLASWPRMSLRRAVVVGTKHERSCDDWRSDRPLIASGPDLISPKCDLLGTAETQTACFRAVTAPRCSTSVLLHRLPRASVTAIESGSKMVGASPPSFAASRKSRKLWTYLSPGQQKTVQKLRGALSSGSQVGLADWHVLGELVHSSSAKGQAGYGERATTRRGSCWGVRLLLS